MGASGTTLGNAMAGLGSGSRRVLRVGAVERRRRSTGRLRIADTLRGMAPLAPMGGGDVGAVTAGHRRSPARRRRLVLPEDTGRCIGRRPAAGREPPGAYAADGMRRVQSPDAWCSETIRSLGPGFAPVSRIVVVCAPSGRCARSGAAPRLSFFPAGRSARSLDSPDMPRLRFAFQRVRIALKPPCRKIGGQ